MIATCFTLPLAAQTFQRTADIRGGSSSNGKCTVEVVVDGAADVEIRGDRAQLRNLAGRPPQWRRFECNGVLPPNPADFRFRGVDGRGRQTLISDPTRGGPAVVRIEDRDNGAEAYTFDITWTNMTYSQDTYRAPAPYPGNYPDPGRYSQPGYGRDTDAWHRDRDGWNSRDNSQMLFRRVADDMDHIRQAVKREYAKIEKPLSAAEMATFNG